MPTNANVFNSRVTSEALEAKFRQVFPAQGGAELVQDLFASGVIQPVVDFSSVAEGSVLAPDLQTAWDFSTGSNTFNNSSGAIITNTGFWQIDLNFSGDGPSPMAGYVQISDGLGTKTVWNATLRPNSQSLLATENKFVVFVRSGDSVLAGCGANSEMKIWYRQIADVYGTLVNPLGFTFS